MPSRGRRRPGGWTGRRRSAASRGCAGRLTSPCAAHQVGRLGPVAPAERRRRRPAPSDTHACAGRISVRPVEHQPRRVPHAAVRARSARCDRRKRRATPYCRRSDRSRRPVRCCAVSPSRSPAPRRRPGRRLACPAARRFPPGRTSKPIVNRRCAPGPAAAEPQPQVQVLLVRGRPHLGRTGPAPCPITRAAGRGRPGRVGRDQRRTAPRWSGRCATAARRSPGCSCRTCSR